MTNQAEELAKIVYNSGELCEICSDKRLNKVEELAQAILSAGYVKLDEVEIEKIIIKYIRNLPIAGDFDSTRAMYLNAGAILGLTKAIVKRDVS